MTADKTDETCKLFKLTVKKMLPWLSVGSEFWVNVNGKRVGCGVIEWWQAHTKSSNFDVRLDAKATSIVTSHSNVPCTLGLALKLDVPVRATLSWDRWSREVYIAAVGKFEANWTPGWPWRSFGDSFDIELRTHETPKRCFYASQQHIRITRDGIMAQGEEGNWAKWEPTHNWPGADIYDPHNRWLRSWLPHSRRWIRIYEEFHHEAGFGGYSGWQVRTG